MLSRLLLHKKKEMNFASGKRKTLINPSRSNQVLEISLASDTLWDQREIKTLLVADRFNQQVLQIGTHCYLPDLGLITLLEQMKKAGIAPELICINDTVGRLSLNVDLWCMKNNTRLMYTCFQALRPALLPRRNRRFLKFTDGGAFKTIREALGEISSRPGKAWFVNSRAR